MLLQVGVSDYEQPSMRYLGREGSTTNVVVYQYTRQTFRAKDLPSCANFALQSTARANRGHYLEGTRAVLDNFYMDDYLDSLESPQRALKRLKHIPHLGGFKLIKFVSNVPNLADQIEGSPQSTEPKLVESCMEESSHVFGLKWDHNNYTLFVSRGTFSTVTESLTQRLILSLVSTVFDLIDLLAPITVGSRLLLKKVCRISCQNRDEELRKDTAENLLNLSAELHKLTKICISKSYLNSQLGKPLTPGITHVRR